MEKRTSAIARIVAVLALAAAVAAVFLVVSSGVENDDAGKNGDKQQQQAKQQQKKPPPTTAKTYEVKPGDTMSQIAYKTGITVQELKALNPESDPLALIAGEILKLR